ILVSRADALCAPPRHVFKSPLIPRKLARQKSEGESLRRWLRRLNTNRLPTEGGVAGISVMNLCGHEEDGEDLHFVAGQEELALDLDFASRMARKHFRILDGPLLAFLGDDGFAVIADFGGEGNGFGRSRFGRTRLCGGSAEQEKGSHEKRGD